MPYLTLFLALLLVACGGGDFSSARPIGLNSDGGTSPSGGAGSSTGGSASGAGTHSGQGGDSTVQPGTGGAAGGAGGDSTTPDWISDAECGPPLVDFDLFPKHFVMDEFSVQSGELCLWCGPGDKPCIAYDVEWDVTFKEWNPQPEDVASLRFREYSVTRVDDDSGQFRLYSASSCGTTSATSCGCSMTFGTALVDHYMAFERTATGYVVSDDSWWGQAPRFCQTDCGFPMTVDEQVVCDATSQEQLDVFSAPFQGMELPCSFGEGW